MECISLRRFIADRSLKATKFIKIPQEKITKCKGVLKVNSTQHSCMNINKTPIYKYTQLNTCSLLVYFVTVLLYIFFLRKALFECHKLRSWKGAVILINNN
jgi:hypothetical protein